MDARISIDSLQRVTTECVLEQRYPHIVQGLLLAWHDPDKADHFLNTILLDDRNDRQGLPEEVFAELMFLSDLNWRRRHYTEEGVQVSAEGFSFGGS